MLYDFNNDIQIANEPFVLTPRENDSITLENFQQYRALETADFNIVKFNSAGPVLFDPHHRHSMFVDECALNTGHVLIAKFGLDGTNQDIHRVRFWTSLIPICEFKAWGKVLRNRWNISSPIWL